jgi:hypothetical protein
MSDKVKENNRQHQRWQQRYDELRAELKAVLESGPIMQGSAVIQRYKRQTKSGLKSCGPYYLWTRKVKGKTVTVSLNEEQYRSVKEAIAVRRQTDKLLKEMQKISQQILLK